MPRPSAHVLTGTRLRERRLALGRRQADVARAAAISAAYLNLIEHNRRPPGPAVLARLAEALDLAPEALEMGDHEAHLLALRAAAARTPGQPAEMAQAPEFAARFPGWAATVVDLAQRAETLERRVVALSDRMAQDPVLAATLHDVLSTATALSSTAAILAEGGDLAPDRAARFHSNLAADSHRLSRKAKALAAHLDGLGAEGMALTPRDEVMAWIAAGRPDLAEADLSDPARTLAALHLARLAEDRAALPDEVLTTLATPEKTEDFPDPVAMAAQAGQPVDLVLRRLAVLRPAGFAQAGAMVCDGTGALLTSRVPQGFPAPRHAEGCPLLPLYQALGQPQTALRRLVETPEGRRFLTFAQASRHQPGGSDGPVLAESVMLILPAPDARGPALAIGPTCRICPREGCPARREPSVLAPL